MEVMIMLFFAVFFIASLGGIIIRLRSMYLERNTTPIELYDDEEINLSIKKIYTSRLSDTSVRGSVRYHNSLYKTNEDYEKYRENIRKLNLP